MFIIKYFVKINKKRGDAHTQKNNITRMKFYETEKFKKLSQEWEKKLQEDGFLDIEKNGKIKQHASNCYRQASAETRRAKEIYFDLLVEFASKEKFETHKERIIMTSLSEGCTRKQIFKRLQNLGYKIHYDMLRYIIKRFEYKWGIKNYTPKQMKLKKLPIR